jgi:hypothetical protein
MKRHLKYRRILTLGFVLFLAGALSAQRSPDRTLLVNGKSTSAVVLQADGHSYVDIEMLAQITNGSVKFEPNQVVLTIPNSNFDANSPQSTPALSKDFASAAIATLADTVYSSAPSGQCVSWSSVFLVIACFRAAWCAMISLYRGSLRIISRT